MSFITIIDIHNLLDRRLSPLGVDSDTIQNLTREMAVLCGIKSQNKQYRVEYIKGGEMQIVIIESAQNSDVEVYNKFHSNPENKGALFLKAVPIE